MALGKSRNERLVQGLLVCAVAAYLVSFALPVFDNTGAGFNHMSVAPRGRALGWRIFLLDAPMIILSCPVWLANPALWLGCWFLWRGRTRAALIAATLGLALALSALQLLSDRSLVYHQRYLSGYYVWLSSFGLLALGGIAASFRTNEVDERKQTGPGA